MDIIAENILFATPEEVNRLKPVLNSDPAPTTQKVGEYTTVLSQTFRHSFKWNDKKKIVVGSGWPIYLHNFGHAQKLNYEPEKNEDLEIRRIMVRELLENGDIAIEQVPSRRQPC